MNYILFVWLVAFAGLNAMDSLINISWSKIEKYNIKDRSAYALELAGSNVINSLPSNQLQEIFNQLLKITSSDKDWISDCSNKEMLSELRNIREEVVQLLEKKSVILNDSLKVALSKNILGGLAFKVINSGVATVTRSQKVASLQLKPEIGNYDSSSGEIEIKDSAYSEPSMHTTVDEFNFLKEIELANQKLKEEKSILQKTSDDLTETLNGKKGYRSELYRLLNNTGNDDIKNHILRLIKKDEEEETKQRNQITSSLNVLAAKEKKLRNDADEIKKDILWKYDQRLELLQKLESEKNRLEKDLLGVNERIAKVQQKIESVNQPKKLIISMNFQESIDNEKFHPHKNLFNQPATEH